MSFFFFLNNQLNPTCAAHILTGVGSSWSTYWPTRSHTPKENYHPISQKGLPWLLRGEESRVLPHFLLDLSGLIMCRQPQGMGAQDCNSPDRPENTISVLSFLTSGLQCHTPPISSSVSTGTPRVIFLRKYTVRWLLWSKRDWRVR